MNGKTVRTILDSPDQTFIAGSQSNRNRNLCHQTIQINTTLTFLDSFVQSFCKFSACEGLCNYTYSFHKFFIVHSRFINPRIVLCFICFAVFCVLLLVLRSRHVVSIARGKRCWVWGEYSFRAIRWTTVFSFSPFLSSVCFQFLCFLFLFFFEFLALGWFKLSVAMFTFDFVCLLMRNDDSSTQYLIRVAKNSWNNHEDVNSFVCFRAGGE